MADRRTQGGGGSYPPVFTVDYFIIGYYTAPVNSADSTDFTGPDKTHSLVLKHVT